MPQNARDYLVDRFLADAVALRERVRAMAQGAKLAGPDATTSQRMANACDEVVGMLQAITTNGDARATLDALLALVPLLEHKAAQHQSAPAVRSVYAGAATRIREVQLAEQSAPAVLPPDADDDDDADSIGAEDAADDADDDDVDDDDLPDDVA
jgi:hypothetical protein